MSKLAENIKNRMQALGLTQKELAEKAGITQVTVHKLLTGKIANSSRIVDLSKALECDTEWLMYGETQSVGELDTEHQLIKKLVPPRPNTKMLPILDHSQASEWHEEMEFNVLEKNITWEESPSSASDNAFWLKVVGDSMMATAGPSIPEGELILVDPKTPAINGSIVVAKLEQSDQVTVKKLVIEAGHKYLAPPNTN